MAALTTAQKSTSLFEPAILRQAIIDACRKLTPRHQLGNPVMFVVWIGSLVTTGLFFQAVFGQRRSTDMVYPQRNALVVVHRPVRQFCGSDGRRPRQGTS